MENGLYRKKTKTPRQKNGTCFHRNNKIYFEYISQYTIQKLNFVLGYSKNEIFENLAEIIACLFCCTLK